MARRSFVSSSQAVPWRDRPSCRARVTELRPGVVATRKAARRTDVSGSRTRSSAVPEVSDPCRRHERHTSSPRDAITQAPWCPQAGQEKEVAERSAARRDRHDASSGNARWNAGSEDGKGDGAGVAAEATRTRLVESSAYVVQPLDHLTHQLSGS